jgi:hypothetical protein
MGFRLSEVVSYLDDWICGTGAHNSIVSFFFRRPIHAKSNVALPLMGRLEQFGTFNTYNLQFPLVSFPVSHHGVDFVYLHEKKRS